jgi:hypothetical protein
MSTTTAVSDENGWTDFAAAHFDDERRVVVLVAQQPKDRSGEVALECAECFQAASAGGLLALQVGTGSRVTAALDDRGLARFQSTGPRLNDDIEAVLRDTRCRHRRDKAPYRGGVSATGSFRTQHPLGAGVNRPSVWSDR